MELEELKAEIESRTGVPANLISGESTEECVSSAKALLAFRRENGRQEPKTNEELFAKYFAELTGIEAEADPTERALRNLDEIAQRSSAYPVTMNPGEHAVPIRRTPEEQFADFMADVTAWNPRKGRGGWI